MSPHQILAACSRLGAIVWFVYAIRQAPESWIHIGSGDNRAPVLVLTAIQLALCAFLWIFPRTVARWILPEVDIVPPKGGMDWRVLGIVLVGLWAFTQAVPRAAYWLIVLGTLISSDIPPVTLSMAQKGQIASTLAELAFASWLVFRARLTAAYIFGVHARGHPNSP